MKMLRAARASQPPRVIAFLEIFVGSFLRFLSSSFAFRLFSFISFLLRFSSLPDFDFFLLSSFKQFSPIEFGGTPPMNNRMFTYAAICCCCYTSFDDAFLADAARAARAIRCALMRVVADGIC